MSHDRWNPDRNNRNVIHYWSIVVSEVESVKLDAQLTICVEVALTWIVILIPGITV
jgi:hypothetical protein